MPDSLNAAMTDSPVRVGCTPTGQCLARIVGRGTMKHSGAFEAFVTRSMQTDPSISVLIDLSDCTYLDSTFLGCLVGLFGQFGQGLAPRVRFHADAPKMKALFGALKLDKILRASDGPAPTPLGETVALQPEVGSDPKTMSRHVMECHRTLARLDTPASAAFLKIADAMERDLARG